MITLKIIAIIILSFSIDFTICEIAEIGNFEISKFTPIFLFLLFVVCLSLIAF